MLIGCDGLSTKIRSPSTRWKKSLISAHVYEYYDFNVCTKYPVTPTKRFNDSYDSRRENKFFVFLIERIDRKFYVG